MDLNTTPPRRPRLLTPDSITTGIGAIQAITLFAVTSDILPKERSAEGAVGLVMAILVAIQGYYTNRKLR